MAYALLTHTYWFLQRFVQFDLLYLLICIKMPSFKDSKVDSSLPVNVVDKVDDEAEIDVSKERLPLWKLFLIAVPWLGVQAVWALEFALTTNYLNVTLGLDQSYGVLIFILGPITGMTVGPTIGALSDNWTGKYGRRRPFVAFGVLTVAVCSMVFCNADKIVPNNTTGALVVAFIAFAILDAFMNVLQGPLRAILADLACDDQQEIVQAFASFFQGAGTIIGNQLVPRLGGLDNIVLIFGVAIAALAVFSVPVFIFGKEKQYVPPVPMKRKDVVRGALKSLYGGLLKMPSSMIKICVVQFFCWLSWMVYNGVNAFYVSNVIYGAADAQDDATKDELTKDGTDFAAEVNSYGGTVQLVFSFCLVLMMKFSPNKVTLVKNSSNYFASFIPAKLYYVMFLVFFPLGFGGIWMADPPSKTLYTVFVCMVYITYAAMNVFPFAICGRLYDISQVGTNMGLLNIFICIPQIIANFSVSAISKSSGDSANMLFAAICGVCAFAACFFVSASSEQVSTTAKEFVIEDTTVASKKEESA